VFDAAIEKPQCDLIAWGTIGGSEFSGAMNQSGIFVNQAGTAQYPSSELINLTRAAGNSVSFMCAPRGSGRRFAIDRDEDGIFNSSDRRLDAAKPSSVRAANPNAPTKVLMINRSDPYFWREAQQREAGVFPDFLSFGLTSGNLIENFTTQIFDLPPDMQVPERIIRSEFETLLNEFNDVSFSDVPAFGSEQDFSNGVEDLSNLVSVGIDSLFNGSESEVEEMEESGGIFDFLGGMFGFDSNEDSSSSLFGFLGLGGNNDSLTSSASNNTTTSNTNGSTGSSSEGGSLSLPMLLFLVLKLAYDRKRKIKIVR